MRVPTLALPSAIRLPTRQLIGLGTLAFTLTSGYVAADLAKPPPPPQPIEAKLAWRRLEPHIQEAAKRHGVPADLVVAIIEVESNFRDRASSPKGARGLMQLMPTTAASLGLRDPFEPSRNIDAGVRHLRRLMKQFDDDLPLVLAAYNAGEGAVLEHCGIPPYPETRAYVARVLSRLDEDSQKATSGVRHLRCSSARVRPRSTTIRAESGANSRG
jgi:soluble lytic murein transglycosylase-like protein